MSDPVDEQHLDALRIRQATALRRSLYRSRAYAVIGALACAAGAVQCAWLVIRQMRGAGFDSRAAALLLLLNVTIVAALLLARRAAALYREAVSTVLPEPRTPPDFSTLSDGSQRARNLEDVR